MEISVIIPFYNAANFIEKSVRSALDQEEVHEVILINDGSTDNSLEVVMSIIDKRIVLLHHEGNINKGRSASRNLGLKRSTAAIIAFLDADDYFLKDRFKNDIKIFNDHIDCDGVYNAVAFDNRIDSDSANDDLYTVTQKVNPDDLFLGLLNGRFGHFQIDGFTIRKQVLEKSGLFNETLKVAEDTDFFWKIALSGNLYTGLIDRPVAMRVVHESNVFYQEDIYKVYNFKMYESMLSWCCEQKVSMDVIDGILRRIWIIKHKDEVPLANEIKYWFHTSFIHRRIYFSYLFIKYFPLVRRRKIIFQKLK